MQALLSCPSCRFSIRPRAAFLSVDHCPRCLATRHVAEPLRVIEGQRSLHPTQDERERIGWPTALP
jgi:Zn-finger nucleic acid-binding protein